MDLAHQELRRRQQAVTYINLGFFDEAAHPRAAAGAAGGTGGQFVPAGQARNERGANAQKNQRAKKNYEDAQRAEGDKAQKKIDSSMSDDELNELSEYLYSFKTKDPKIVALRIKAANELARRGRNVNDYGGLGKGTKPKGQATNTGTPKMTSGGLKGKLGVGKSKSPNPVDASKMSSKKAKELRAQGWKANPKDKSEKLYPPGHPQAKK